jgi:SET domain-containing protein
MQKYSWLSPKISVSITEDRGKGLFANKDIDKDELILVMGGYIFSIEDENNLNEYNEDKPIEISEDFSFSPVSEADTEKMPQHYINHSCEPNCGWRGQLFLVAMKTIKEGEELTYDYAMIMHPNNDSETYFEMDCLCGKDACRKKISEHDWEKQEIQEKYDGYFQFHIQRKLDAKKRGEEIKPLYKLPFDWKHS